MPPADPIPLPLHGLFEIAAFVVGGWVYGRQRAPLANAIPEATRWRIVIGSAVGALIGSRALAALEHPSLFDGASGLQIALLVFGTKTIVGGLLGGLVGVELTKLAMREKRRSGDAFVFPLVAAIAVGRIGCFLAGVNDGTAGLPTDLPWGLDQGDGIPRHPTALYEILVVLALGAVLFWLHRRQRPLARTDAPQIPVHALPPGLLFALFLSGYLAWRLGAEFLKPVEPLALGLSAIQWACVVGLLHYLRLFAGRRFTPATHPADASGARGER